MVYDPYRDDENIVAMVKRLRHGKRADWKVENVARAVLIATPWAGRPIPWDEMPQWRLDEYLSDARSALYDDKKGN